MQNAAIGTLSLERTTTASEFKNYNIEIPILMRYNINNFIGVGAGIQSNVNGNQNEINSKKIVVFEGPTESDFVISTTQSQSENSRSFQNFKVGILFDATFGIARIGPSLGLRYVLNSEKNFNYYQIYGIWKF